MRHIFIPFIFITSLFPQQSKLYKAVEHISNYIVSERFNKLFKTNTDLQLIDSIYVNQLKYQNYDYSETLLSLTFALVPVRKISIKFPLLNKINYPLISVTDSLFNLKNKYLPKYIFWDTPQNDFGDKDKLSHFFGSAFISYSSNIFDFVDLIGYFVEVFEENFKLQSTIDKRDMMANTLGNIFGKMLKDNKNILPSQILITRTLSHFRFNQ
ncbi:MAG: hypothetical protein IIB07_02585 [Bacteroidetes bacterium]|nr:hypothetical protein [Bacteroidota bacterium]MCH8170005.1 hypothetical protein [Bacteroidota bacterium]